MVKGAKDHHCGQQQEGTRDEHFLDGSPFRCWPSLHAPLESCGVLQTQVNARHTRRDGKDDDKHPRLPVIEGPCWQKQQHPKRDQSKKSCSYCLKTCFHDLFSLFSLHVPSSHRLSAWTWNFCRCVSLFAMVMASGGRERLLWASWLMPLAALHCRLACRVIPLVRVGVSLAQAVPSMQ